MADSISSEELAGLLEAFKIHDEDGDGIIDTERLRSVLAAFGQNPSDAEIQDSTDDIDLPEFIDLMAKNIAESDEEEEDIFDKDGLVGSETPELESLMANLGLAEDLTEEEVESWIRELDVDYEEFFALFSDVKTV